MLLFLIGSRIIMPCWWMMDHSITNNMKLRNKSNSKYNPSLSGRAGRYNNPRNKDSNDDTSNTARKTRAKREKEIETEDNRKKARAFTPIAPSTPDQQRVPKIKERALRNKTPTCLHFESDPTTFRHLFPEYIICRNCEQWSIDSLFSGRQKRNSRRYRCKGGHTSFIHPTSKRKSHFTINLADLPEDMEESSDDDVEMNLSPVNKNISTRNLTHRAITPDDPSDEPRQLQFPEDPQALNQSLAENDIKFTALLQKHKELKRNFNSYVRDAQKYRTSLQCKYDKLLEEHQTALTSNQNESAEELVLRAIHPPVSVNFNSVKQKKKRVSMFVRMIMQTTFLEGYLHQEIVDQVTVFIRENVYTPWNILREMDKSGHKLSLEGVEVLRNVPSNLTKKY
jgi:hypothetical protein